MLLKFDPPIKIYDNEIHSLTGLISYTRYYIDRYNSLKRRIQQETNEAARRVFNKYVIDLEKRAAELKLKENDATYWKKQYLRLREKNRRKHLEQVNNLTSDPIVLSTMAKLNDRSRVGVNKYGTTLAQNNTDNFLVHLQQELLDGANYIEKLIQDNEH